MRKAHIQSCVGLEVGISIPKRPQYGIEWDWPLYEQVFSPQQKTGFHFGEKPSSTALAGRACHKQIHRRAIEEPETPGLRPKLDLRVITTKHKRLLRDYSAPLRSLPSQVTNNKERKCSMIRFPQPILKAVPFTFTVSNTQHCTAEQERPSRQCRVIVRWIAKCTYEVRRLGFVDVQ